MSERQKGDVVFAQLLNRVRTGTHTSADIELLKTRLLPNLGLTVDSPELKDLPFLYATNQMVNQHNQRRQELLQRELAKRGGDVRVLRSVACDEFSEKQDKKAPQAILDSLPDNLNLTGGCMKVLELLEGSRVMLRRNVATEDGLVNGSTGAVWNWPDEYHPNGLVTRVNVKFDPHDKIQVGAEQRKKIAAHLLPANEPLVVPILPIEVLLQHKGMNITRTQIPLVVAFAITIHKSQGQTFVAFVVGTNGMRSKTAGMIYVALSRGKSLNGLYLVELDFSKILADPGVMAEVARLQRVSRLVVDVVPRNRLPLIDNAAKDTHRQLKQERKQTRKGDAGVLKKMVSYFPSRKEEDARLAAEESTARDNDGHRRLPTSKATLDKIVNNLTSIGGLVRQWKGDIAYAIGGWKDFALPTFRKFSQNNAKDIWLIIHQIQSLEPINCNGHDNRYAKDETALTKLFPHMLDHLVPVTTTGDGNCLFNAVSTSIFGHEEYNSLLRALALFVLLLLEDYFIKLAQRAQWWTYSGYEWALHPGVDFKPPVFTTREERREKFHHMCAEVWSNFTYCDYFHAHALSIVLGRPIYSYTSCIRKPTRAGQPPPSTYILYDHEILNAGLIRDAFLAKHPALNGMYTLTTGDTRADRMPVTLFNTGVPDHFVSLVRLDPIPAASLFPPANVVFTVPITEDLEAPYAAGFGPWEVQLQDLRLPPHFIRAKRERSWTPQPTQP